MKTATYTLLGGEHVTVEYDELAPCRICGEPVIEASMGGTDVCPWCDCGRCRYCGASIFLPSDMKRHVAYCKQLAQQPTQEAGEEGEDDLE